MCLRNTVSDLAGSHLMYRVQSGTSLPGHVLGLGHQQTNLSTSYTLSLSVSPTGHNVPGSLHEWTLETQSDAATSAWRSGCRPKRALGLESLPLSGLDMVACGGVAGLPWPKRDIRLPGLRIMSYHNPDPSTPRPRRLALILRVLCNE